MTDTFLSEPGSIDSDYLKVGKTAFDGKEEPRSSERLFYEASLRDKILGYASLIIVYFCILSIFVRSRAGGLIFMEESGSTIWPFCISDTPRCMCF